MLRTETPELTAYKAAIKFSVISTYTPGIQKLLSTKTRYLSEWQKTDKRYWLQRTGAIVAHTLRRYPLKK